MNILELEEGLRNLIATQPMILSGENAGVISGIKNIIEAHKAFSFRVSEYPSQDILKIGLMNESSKLELNLTSYACQILQEKGINIMLYVPKYAMVYNQQISRYVDNVLYNENSNFEVEETVVNEDIVENFQPETKNDKYVVVEKKQAQVETEKVDKNKELKSENKQAKKLGSDVQSEGKGRDYLMELLKK